MKKNAFTLVELLAVVVILSIIMVVGVPRVINVIETSRIESKKILGETLIKGAMNKFASDFDSPNVSKTYTITNGAFVGDQTCPIMIQRLSDIFQRNPLISMEI